MIRWRLASPAARATPVAVFELSADDQSQLDAALAEVATITKPHSHRLAMIVEVDQGLVARPDPTTALLMPHGGPVITRAIERALQDRFGAPAQPEESDLDARIARALATTRSPLAIDLLLDQSRKWGTGLASDADRDRRLAALLQPPTVALWGPPNVGKSTLLNTLAGRSAALVADAPGTTRDHVGVEIDFAGLVCRVLDLPGIRATDDRVEAGAIEIAKQAAIRADLLIMVGDATHPPVELPAGFQPTNTPIRLGLRADLAEPGPGFDVGISARTGKAMSEFVTRVRDAFVSPDDLASERPWQFWADPAPGAS